jgi:large subunit ribosomal protein L10
VLTRAEKEGQVATLKDKFSRATSIYVADYRGIDVAAVTKLRRKVHQEGGGDYEYRVIKNSVLRRAVEGSDASGLGDHFEGPSAVAISYGDPVGLAKVLADFAKENQAFELKGGMIEGEIVDRAEIAVLAALPTLDTLRGMLVGLIQAPASKLARLLNEPGAQLARLLAAHARQEEA